MLTSRFSDGLLYAFELHADQVRKGSETPYIAHLLSVCALVIENGGDEDQAIAALLHDAVEDQGGMATLDVIRQRFGKHVAQIVAGCTDAYTTPKPPWRARKDTYLAELRSAGLDVQLVSLADKLHNARSLLLDFQQFGPAVWDRFNGGKEGSLWYYRALADYFTGSPYRGLAGELERVVAEIERLANA